MRPPTEQARSNNTPRRLCAHDPPRADESIGRRLGGPAPARPETAAHRFHSHEAAKKKKSVVVTQSRGGKKMSGPAGKRRTPPPYMFHGDINLNVSRAPFKKGGDSFTQARRPRRREKDAICSDDVAVVDVQNEQKRPEKNK